LKTFADFQFPIPLTEALEAMGYETPTPVQGKAIPLVLENRDVLATAQTGTGKTAAFALPLIAKMLGINDGKPDMRPALIVAPTRELAEQIGAVLEQLTTYCPQIKAAVVIGGTAYPKQIRQLRSNPMFVVGTPGRLIDQVRLGHLKLSTFGALVMDEADRMLDMGFEPQMNELISHLPKERQTLLFSATLPEEVMRLAGKYLRTPVRVSVGEVSKPIDKIKQDVIKVTTSSKDQTLVQEIDKVAGSVLIFVKTKWKTEKLAQFLDGVGHDVGRIHGDRSQTQRSNAIREFREGKIRILVATDIAARGLDIPHIEHVINYDLPMAAEDYVHRIGRTARAGAEGHSIAFVTPEETMLWARIHKLIYGKFPDQGYNKPGSFQGKGRGGRSGDQKMGREFISGAKPGRPRDARRAAAGKSDASSFGSDRASAGGDRRRSAANRTGPNRADRRADLPRGPRDSRFESESARGQDLRAAGPGTKRIQADNPRRMQEEMAQRFLDAERRAMRPGGPRKESRGDGRNGAPRADNRSGAPRADGPRSAQRTEDGHRSAPRGDGGVKFGKRIDGTPKSGSRGAPSRSGGAPARGGAPGRGAGGSGKSKFSGARSPDRSR
jgi:ATP-dependent RNA helicase DeaD